MKLSELEPGAEAVVLDVQGDSNVKKKLLVMGIVRGTQLKVIRNAPLKDPMEIEVRGYNLSIRKAEAENVIVEVLK